MTKILKARWTADIRQDVAALKAMTPLRVCVFSGFLGYMHMWAARHNCHDEVIGSWWYHALGKIKVRSRKNERFHAHLDAVLAGEVSHWNPETGRTY